MVKKNLLRSLSVVMACMMAVMTVACGANTAESDTAASAAKTQETAKLEDSIISTVASHAPSGDAGKVETVYVTADANGAVNDVIVSEWLKNASASSEIADTTELKDIVNVKGDETYTDNGDGTVTWEAEGSDIYYQGTTDKELPVDMKITYTLDGKEITPEELAGKSGRVTIRFDYDNKAKQTVDVDGKEIEVYTPFAMVSGMMLDSDKFTNVEISNGKVISDGGNYIVMGVALPGLKESLDISDEKWDEINGDDKELDNKLSNHFEITADTSDFEMGMTVTMASSDLLSDFGVADLTDSDKISDLKGDMEELSDGSTRLVDGSKELKDGTKQLRDGSKELYEGTGKLYDGTKELADGTGQLKDGSAKLADGAGQLADGTSQLYEGTGTLANGTSQLYDGTGSLADGASKLSDGSKTLSAGIKEYTDGVAKVNAGAGKLSAGAASAKTGSEQVAAGIKSAHEGSQGLADGMAQLNEGVKKINELAARIPALLQKKQQMESQKAALEATYTFLTSPGTECSDVVLATLNTVTDGKITSKEYAVAVRDAGIAAMSQQTGGAEVEPAGAEADAPEASSGTLSSTDEEQPAAPEDKEEGTETPDEETSSDDQQESEPAKSDEDKKPSQDENASDDADDTDEEGETTQPVNDRDEQIPVGGSADAGNVEFTEEQWAYINQLIQQKVGAVVEQYEQAIAQKTKETQAQVAQTVTLVSTYTGALGATRASINILGQVLASFDGLDFSEESLAQLAQLSAGVEKLAAGSAQLNAGLGQLDTGAAQLDAGIGSLQTGAAELYKGTGTLVANNDKLNKGAAELGDGAGKLGNGAKQLKDGAGKVNDGAKELRDGAGRLNDGAKELKSGADQLSSGIVTLDNGANELKNGAKDLNDGAGKLNDGIVTLDDGVAELLEGVTKLDNEGIKKLYEAFDGDLTDFADKITAIQEASKNYTSFAGSNADEKSSVKFIIKTAGVKSENL